MHTKWAVLRVVTDLRGGVELGHLLVDEECVRDPDLLDVVSTHHQLPHLRLGHRHTDNNNINMLSRKEHIEYSMKEHLRKCFHCVDMLLE